MRVIRALIDSRVAGVRPPGGPGQATSLEYTLRDGGGSTLDFNPTTQLLTLTNSHGSVSVHVSRLQELELAAPEKSKA